MMKYLGRILLVTLVLTMSGCVTYPQHRGYGPPPHAPAHGYRYMHDGAVLVYDAGLGLYVVRGFPGVYFYNNRYYRWHKKHWTISHRYDGPWKLVHRKYVPPSLRDRGYRKHRSGGAR
jgi:hypothetical protein